MVVVVVVVAAAAQRVQFRSAESILQLLERRSFNTRRCSYGTTDTVRGHLPITGSYRRAASNLKLRIGWFDGYAMAPAAETAVIAKVLFHDPHNIHTTVRVVASRR